MIICPRCSKENQDHYKFCLGCGNELPRVASQAPKDFRMPTPSAGLPAVEVMGQEAGDVALAQMAFGAQAAPRAISEETDGGGVAGDASPCPSCGTMVPSGFKFCGSCGYPMAASGSAVRVTSDRAGAHGSTGPTRGMLVLVHPDGSEGERVALGEGSTQIGRSHGAVFASDAYLSPLHATLSFKNEQLWVRDEGSLNGIYVKIERNVATPLLDGAMFRIGQEIIRYEALQPPGVQDGVERMGSPHAGVAGRLCLVVGRNPSAGNAFPIPAHGVLLGRERGDVLFPEDGYVSGLHCRVQAEGANMVLTDVGSSNGTFLRVRGEQMLRHGDLLLMGQQLFRVDL